jgi:hypothetical protein
MVFGLDQLRGGARSSSSNPPRTYRNPLTQAHEWQHLLQQRRGDTRADLARHLGVSRARVSQVLALLRLSPDLQRRILDFGDPLPRPFITERRLRPLLKESREQQLAVFLHLAGARDPRAVETP